MFGDVSHFRRGNDYSWPEFLIFCEGKLRHTIPLDPPGKHLIGSKFVSNFRDGWKDRIAGSNGEGTM